MALQISTKHLGTKPIQKVSEGNDTSQQAEPKVPRDPGVQFHAVNNASRTNRQNWWNKCNTLILTIIQLGSCNFKKKCLTTKMISTDHVFCIIMFSKMLIVISYPYMLWRGLLNWRSRNPFSSFRRKSSVRRTPSRQPQRLFQRCTFHTTTLLHRLKNKSLCQFSFYRVVKFGNLLTK